MKIYDLEWATAVYRQFRQCNPRVVQVDLLIIQAAQACGYILTREDVSREIIRLLRVPAIGKYAWKDYKSMVKSNDTVSLEEVQRLYLKMNHSARVARDELNQKLLPLFET